MIKKAVRSSMLVVILIITLFVIGIKGTTATYAAVATMNSLNWKGLVATWEKVPNAMCYDVIVYYSKDGKTINKTGIPCEVYGSTNYFDDEFFQVNKSGYYKFTVEALDSNNKVLARGETSFKKINVYEVVINMTTLDVDGIPSTEQGGYYRIEDYYYGGYDSKTTVRTDAELGVTISAENHFDVKSVKINGVETQDTSFILNESKKYVIDAVFQRIDEVTVNLELGEKHTEFAEDVYRNRRYSDFLIEDHVYDPDLENFVTVSNFTLNGTTLTYTVPANTKIGDVVRDIGYLYPSQRVILDEGEFTYHGGGGYGFVGLEPVSTYDSERELLKDIDDHANDTITDGQTFYVTWKKPLESVDVEIESPKCGTEVSVDENKWGVLSPGVKPEVSCSGNASSNIAYWTNDAVTQWRYMFNYRDLFSGTFKGDEDYYAIVSINPDWGYFFYEGYTEVTINGEEPDFCKSPECYTGDVGIYVTAEHAYDENWVTEKKPTCSSMGMEADYCTGNCGQKETQEIDIDPDAHDWGEWKVTKKATALSAGEKQRVCKHDSSHVEKATVAKLPVSGTLIAQMTSKGSKAMNLSWTKVNNADGYDIFFARCNHSGKNIACKRVKSIKGNKTFKWSKTGLNKNTSYKAYVKAYVMKNGKKSYVRTSPLIHAYTSGGDKKYTNPKSVSVKKASVSLKKGRTYSIKVTVAKLKNNKKLISSSHAPKLRYISSNPGIATVNKAGKITAKKTGSCTVYAYAANGVRKTVKVTVN